MGFRGFSVKGLGVKALGFLQKGSKGCRVYMFRV